MGEELVQLSRPVIGSGSRLMRFNLASLARDLYLIWVREDEQRKSA